MTPVSVALNLPEDIVTNDELCAQLGHTTTSDWIERKTGIRERRFFPPATDTVEALTAAGAAAIEAANMQPSDVKFVITACTTADWLLPAMSVRVAAALGITTPHLYDLTQTACASAVYATTLAASLMHEGPGSALIICADFGSRVTDPFDRATRIFFGDAVGAMILTKSDDGLVAYDLGNEYSPAVRQASHHLTRHTKESPYLYMDGKSVWDTAIRVVPKSIRKALADASLSVSQVEAIAFHQANIRLIQEIMRQTGASHSQVAITADTLGNTAAASPLTALYSLTEQGKCKKGNRLVLSAIGAGFFWGTCVFSLGEDISLA